VEDVGWRVEGVCGEGAETSIDLFAKLVSAVAAAPVSLDL
jgi:hypothetical protein